MTDPNVNDSEFVDRLVAAALDHQAAAIDAGSLIDRIEEDRLSALSVGRVDGPRRLTRRVLSWSVAAAVVVTAFLGGRAFSPAVANASTLLRSVRTVHRQAVDRCYLVQFAPEADSGIPAGKVGGASESVLWTRGDHFWSDCAIGAKRLKIGRDESGTVWLAPEKNKGIRFSPDRTAFPKDVETICRINSLTVPVLVDDVLAGFDLRSDGPTKSAGGLRTIVWARLKPGKSHSLLSAATMEVDAERDVVTRLVLWLQKDGAPNGTVTYTLVDRPSPPKESYRLESHLDPGATIEDHTFEKAKPTPSAS